MVAEGRYAHGITPDWICPERLRLLRFAKAVSNDHGEILVGFRSVAVARRPEIFEALMKQVKESSGRLKQAFKAYTDHLDSHGCGRFETPQRFAWQKPGRDGVSSLKR